MSRGSKSLPLSVVAAVEDAAGSNQERTTPDSLSSATRPVAVSSSTDIGCYLAFREETLGTWVDEARNLLSSCEPPRKTACQRLRHRIITRMSRHRDFIRRENVARSCRTPEVRRSTMPAI